MARRCSHVYSDGHPKAGQQCGSPVIYDRQRQLCRPHAGGAAGPRTKGWRAMSSTQILEKDPKEPTHPDFYEVTGGDPDFDVVEVAKKLGQSKQNTYKNRWWLRLQVVLERERQAWVPPGDEHGAFPDTWFALAESDIDRLVADFTRFRERFFKTPRREPFATPPFMQRWVKAILHALVTGGRLSILSPPRHGKTELLIHFSTWLICRWPDIQIVWVGGNERIAQRAVGLVAQHLATNQELIDEYAGPGGSFKPRPKDSLPWSKSEFSVVTRSQPEKGRTMTALGRGGTLTSLDASILISDDLEDHSATMQPGAREATRDWWTSQFESRKEEWTALFNIGSRQHPDDLSGHLLENPEYTTIVETAHDDACVVPEDQPDAHVDCMLFPGLRSYKYLMSQKRASETTGGLGVFEMVYLNKSSAEGLQVFSKEIVNQCVSEAHVVGQLPKHSGRLVAGLDPAGAAGYQAAVLLWFTLDWQDSQSDEPEPRVVVVDIDNTRGGGIPQFGRIMREWYEKYRVAHWVVESNLHQGLMTQDRDIRDYASQHGIHLEDIRTQYNKLDPNVGVTAMQPLFANKQIVIPAGDSASLEKTEVFRRQLINWDGSAPRNRNKTGQQTDIVMAAWFAWTVFRRARAENFAEMGVDYGDYPGSDFNEAPWSGPNEVPW